MNISPLSKQATAVAHPNIAFIKYWGNQDDELRIPVNSSLSMNLSGLETRTSVTFDPSLEHDELSLNGAIIKGDGLGRVSKLLDRIREHAGTSEKAVIDSTNNFPTGTGIASSASAFAALALAASKAAGLDLDEKTLTTLARTGSGSASRSIPTGFVEWHQGSDHINSYSESIAPPEHWALADCVAIVSSSHKSTGSTGGHALAPSSPFQSARVADAPRRLAICRNALLDRDFAAFAEIVELDSNMMHAVMQTSTPRLLYWQPGTIEIMQAVMDWRAEGIEVCYTIDAGPNVHVICTEEVSDEITWRIKKIPFVKDVLVAAPGGPAQLVE